MTTAYPKTFYHVGLFSSTQNPYDPSNSTFGEAVT